MSTYFRQDFYETKDEAQLFFQVQGPSEIAKSPGMILCDGLGCDGFAWKYLIPQLRKSHRVLRWHYRGHGRSSLPEDPERLGMLYTCDDLARLMDHVGLENAVLFGHSMGVQVALEFHRRYSDRVKGLVLLCGSYGNPLDTFHDSTTLRTLFPYLHQIVERFPDFSSRVMQTVMKTEIPIEVALRTGEMNKELIKRTDVEPYFDHLAKMSPVAFVRTLNSLAEHSCWDHLPHVDVPTLVIGGEKDQFTPVWLSHRMADTIPDAEFLLVPSGTHTAPLEQPQLVGQRVERFLEKRVLNKTASAQKPRRAG
jgi:pimeloyl-ACP methyl ester carboxylesterase